MNERLEEISVALGEVRARIQAAVATSHRLPSEVTLIAVTKTYPASDVKILHDLGVRDFAENRDHEGREKSAQVDGTWHFQGQIQSNKISSIANWAQVVHSLDEPRHVALLAKAVPLSTRLSVFIQVCLDPAPGRGGVLPSLVAPLADRVNQSPSLKLEGLMAVAPLGENPESAFSRLAQIHSNFRQQFPDSPSLSAGMSGDFEVAISHGATHVRIGSSILGSRSHHG
ncbi:MAG: YggS family pyridoxal phosphate-dependent enzyme [Candidatus Nanopelagicaceae bacterium]|nr:YggS family pyridoxal phosphate-dependent enzyme [Candidatus Nanopelagicaceae bacterium]